MNAPQGSFRRNSRRGRFATGRLEDRHAEQQAHQPGHRESGRPAEHHPHRGAGDPAAAEAGAESTGRGQGHEHGQEGDRHPHAIRWQQDRQQRQDRPEGERERGGRGGVPRVGDLVFNDVE